MVEGHMSTEGGGPGAVTKARKSSLTRVKHWIGKRMSPRRRGSTANLDSRTYKALSDIDGAKRARSQSASELREVEDLRQPWDDAEPSPSATITLSRLPDDDELDQYTGESEGRQSSVDSSEDVLPPEPSSISLSQPSRPLSPAAAVSGTARHQPNPTTELAPKRDSSRNSINHQEPKQSVPNVSEMVHSLPPRRRTSQTNTHPPARRELEASSANNQPSEHCAVKPESLPSYRSSIHTADSKTGLNQQIDEPPRSLSETLRPDFLAEDMENAIYRLRQSLTQPERRRDSLRDSNGDGFIFGSRAGEGREGEVEEEYRQSLSENQEGQEGPLTAQGFSRSKKEIGRVEIAEKEEVMDSEVSEREYGDDALSTIYEVTDDETTSIARHDSEDGGFLDVSLSSQDKKILPSAEPGMAREKKEVNKREEEKKIVEEIKNGLQPVKVLSVQRPGNDREQGGLPVSDGPKEKSTPTRPSGQGFQEREPRILQKGTASSLSPRRSEAGGGDLGGKITKGLEPVIGSASERSCSQVESCSAAPTVNNKATQSTEVSKLGDNPAYAMPLAPKAEGTARQEKTLIVTSGPVKEIVSQDRIPAVEQSQRASDSRVSESIAPEAAVSGPGYIVRGNENHAEQFGAPSLSSKTLSESSLSRPRAVGELQAASLSTQVTSCRVPGVSSAPLPVTSTRLSSSSPQSCPPAAKVASPASSSSVRVSSALSNGVCSSPSYNHSLPLPPPLTSPVAPSPSAAVSSRPLSFLPAPPAAPHHAGKESQEQPILNVEFEVVDGVVVQVVHTDTRAGVRGSSFFRLAYGRARERKQETPRETEGRGVKDPKPVTSSSKSVMTLTPATSLPSASLPLHPDTSSTVSLPTSSVVRRIDVDVPSTGEDPRDTTTKVPQSEKSERKAEQSPASIPQLLSERKVKTVPAPIRTSFEPPDQRQHGATRPGAGTAIAATRVTLDLRNLVSDSPSVAFEERSRGATVTLKSAQVVNEAALRVLADSPVHKIQSIGAQWVGPSPRRPLVPNVDRDPAMKETKKLLALWNEASSQALQDRLHSSPLLVSTASTSKPAAQTVKRPEGRVQTLEAIARAIEGVKQRRNDSVKDRDFSLSPPSPTSRNSRSTGPPYVSGAATTNYESWLAGRVKEREKSARLEGEVMSLAPRKKREQLSPSPELEVMKNTLKLEASAQRKAVRRKTGRPWK